MFSDKEREDMLCAYDKRFKMEEILVVASILNPITKNLNCVSDFLNERHQNASEFLVQFGNQFDIQMNNLMAQEQI